jgi:hypothetical protein
MIKVGTGRTNVDVKFAWKRSREVFKGEGDYSNRDPVWNGYELRIVDLRFAFYLVPRDYFPKDNYTKLWKLFVEDSDARHGEVYEWEESGDRPAPTLEDVTEVVLVLIAGNALFSREGWEARPMKRLHATDEALWKTEYSAQSRKRGN